jgi:TolB-like protein/Flp pilus assembly protein TadD
MPFVEGESLRDRLRRERQLAVDDALQIAREAARALDYAHQHGVVHRDIKPENILLTGDGSTLVADFGIARALGSAADSLTQTGFAIGTPAYMSPEQAAGDKTIDARTDVYSLAAVLFEMLAGEAPWTGPTAQTIIAKRLSEPPPSVRKARPAVPESVDLAIRKALAPMAADRFAGAAQFAQALQPAPVTTPAAVPTAVAPTAAHRTRRRVPVAALTLVLGLLIGVGALFAWRRSHGNAESLGERRIAVLPFQNLGDSADAYFADGMTDAVRGKLTALPSMRVIGSNSSAQYKGTTKTAQQIGRELGVDYLLVGKIRWQKGPSGASRVQVSPELIDVTTADAKWQQPFDASLTDVFQVQADIAGRVADALDVAIGTKQQRALEERPTANLTAYDTYLRGKAARALGANPVTLRQAITLFEQAVALDSNFVAAWGALSDASSLLYGSGRPSPELGDAARSAAERALQVGPDRPNGYQALGDYYRRVTLNNARALEQYTKGLKLVPGDADLLRGLGLVQQGLGEWDQAVQSLRRSWSLDPRSPTTTYVLGGMLLWTRRYGEALTTLDKALVLSPASLQAVEDKAMVYLAQGDLDRARSFLAQPPAGIELSNFVAYIATYWDLYWALDSGQRALVKRLTPSAFDGDVGNWGLALAGMYQVEGDRKQAAAYGDSARVGLEQQLKVTPEDPTRNVLLGVALAYTGRRDEAIRAGERGLALQPVKKDATNGPYNQHQLARIFILLGEPEKALDQLEPLLKIPYYLSPGWLKIDPTFDPIRKHPRFQKLLNAAPVAISR